MQREVYIVSGVRTAIGDFGGSLKDIPPTELGAQVAREALSRASVAGEAEGMSRAGYLATGMRWGARMGDSTMLDMMTAALHDPFHNIHMGITAENLAETHQITRGQQDELAVLSHQRAARAIQE